MSLARWAAEDRLYEALSPETANAYRAANEALFFRQAAVIAEAQEGGAPRYLLEAAVMPGPIADLEALRPYAPDAFHLWELSMATVLAWTKLVRAEAPDEKEVVDAAVVALAPALEALFAAGFDPALVVELAEAVRSQRGGPEASPRP